MKTWITTGMGCLLATALLGGLCREVVADDRQEEGQNQPRDEARPTAAPGVEQGTIDRDRPARDRNGNRQEQNGRAALGVFLGPSPTTGARVQSVQPQSAAAQAGLRPGDFILSINDAKIGRPEDVQQAVAGLEPGREAQITIWRNGQMEELTVMLGERRVAGFRGDDPAASDDRRVEGRAGGQGWLGMALGETQNGEGVRVQGIAPDGPAARAGLRAGDVITGIGSDNVARAGELMNALQNRRAGEDVWLSIIRDGEEHAVKVTMADSPRFSGSQGTRERRGFRGDFAGDASNQGMARFLEEHQRFAERLDRLEAEVQALKSKLGTAPRDDRPNGRPPRRED